MDIAGRAQTSRSKQLRRQMRQWREALDRTQIPGLPGVKKHVTQEEAAVLCGRAVSHYRALESGDIRKQYSDEVLDSVATVLKLGAVSRRVLYLLATEREPKPGPFAAPEISAAVRSKLACQPWPAYVLDSCWNVIEYNAAALQWFPHLASENNTMRALVSVAELRHRLVDWETVWLPRAIAQLKGQLAYPRHGECLDKLATEVLNLCPEARDLMYHDMTVWMYEDGDVRQLFLPGASEPTTVELSADVSGSNHGMRIVSVVPRGGYIPPCCKPYVGAGAAIAALAAP